MSLRSKIVPYSRLQPGDIDRQTSIDLTQSPAVGYELENWNTQYSVPSSNTSAIEPRERADPTYASRNSGFNKVDLILRDSDVTSQNEGTAKDVQRSVGKTLKSWWRELLALSISVASLVSIAGILLVYQNKPLSSWQFRYLPNSVVSQLMTVSRSALMFSTASCVGQLSWLHIQRKSRALSDLQVFDGASRGPAGAAWMLLFPTRYRIPALVAALITIATLLMDPFTQQVLQFPLRDHIVQGNATFPTTQKYAPVPGALIASANSQANEANVNASIQAAIVGGFFDAPSANAYACPTNSSCAWESAATLWICSSCTNVTSATNMSCLDTNRQGPVVCNWTTPANFMLQSTTWSRSAIQQLYTRINTTARASGGDTRLVDFATLTRDRQTNIHECTLSWCARVFRNATAQGSFFSAQVDNHSLISKGYWFDSGNAYYQVLEAEPGFPATLNATFTVQVANSQYLAKFLTSILNTGSLTEYTGNNAGMSNAFSLGTAMLSNPSIPYMSANIATSMTNVIRNLTATDYIIQNTGDSHIQIQYVKVRWPWFSFPATIVLLGTLLLLTTMIQSHRENALVWKCSPLALLFHPLQGWGDEELNHASKNEMEESAKGMRGQLLRDKHVGFRIFKT